MASTRRTITGHRDLADHLRQQIATGTLASGARFPSEKDLQDAYGLARDTVRDAIHILRTEGLVVVRHGQASRVRTVHETQPVDMSRVERITVRMPSPDERDRLGMHDGIPVIEVWRPRRKTPDLLAGDRWHIPGPTAR